MDRKNQQKKKVIIGIHGLSNKPAPRLLERWWLLAIKEGIERNFGQVNNLPEFKMVYWADVMNDRPLDPTLTDKEDPYYEEEPYAPGTGEVYRDDHFVRKKVLDFINSQLDKVFLNEDLTINYFFIADRLIQKYFLELDAYFKNEFIDNSGTTKRVKDILNSRLTEALESHKNDEIFLIAHSMGSIIAYEVLSMLPEEIKIATFITIGSPLGLPVVKSRIAAGFKEYHFGRTILNVPDSIKTAWFNFSDIEDNVALNYKLSDDFVPNKFGVGVVDYEVENDYIFNNHKNPHKAYGYLRTPELSRVIQNFIPPGQETFTRKIFERIAGLIRS